MSSDMEQKMQDQIEGSLYEEAYQGGRESRQAEIDALTAHVKRQNTIIVASIKGLEANDMHGGVRLVRDYLKDGLTETPAQSLAAHDKAIYDKCSGTCYALDFTDDSMFETSGHRQIRIDAAGKCAEAIDKLGENND